MCCVCLVPQGLGKWWRLFWEQYVAESNSDITRSLAAYVRFYMGSGLGYLTVSASRRTKQNALIKIVNKIDINYSCWLNVGFAWKRDIKTCILGSYGHEQITLDFCSGTHLLGHAVIRSLLFNSFPPRIGSFLSVLQLLRHIGFFSWVLWLSAHAFDPSRVFLRLSDMRWSLL